MRTRTLALRFPVGGLDRRSDYQSQPPFTTYSAQNVRPIDSIDRRERGGSRPGVNKYYYEQLGSGNPVRMLGQVTYVRADAFQYWTDNFGGVSLGSAWTAASWLASAPSLIEDSFSSTTATGVEQGVTRSAFSPNIDTAQDYWLEMYIVPFEGAHGGEYVHWFRMNDATPVGTTAGVEARLILTSTGYSGTLKVYSGGVVAESYSFSTGSFTLSEPGWFRVKISTNTVTCYWAGNTLISQLLVTAAAGKRIGFSIKAVTAAFSCLIDTYRVQYKVSGYPRPYHVLPVASANGGLYRESLMGQMSLLSTNLSINSDRLILCAERGQKLYIADWGDPIAYGTDGTGGTGVNKFDSATFTNWTTLGGNIYDYMLIVSNVTGNVIAGSYELSAIAAGELTTTTNCNSGAGGTSKFYLQRCPKIYDPVTDTLTRWIATTGTVPTGCPLIALYRDRLFLGGAWDAPHQWYASRQADPLDWNYASQDAGGAIAGNNTNAGQIGEPLTAMIPFGDSFMIMGCQNSTWILRGDPCYGGELHAISREVGPIFRGARCKGPTGEVLILTRDGLYIIAGESCVSLSRERLPKELLNLDPKNTTITMAYDSTYRGVHIRITAETSAVNKHWWFDYGNKGFWPDKFQTTHEATALMQFNATDANETAVLQGCRDGYIRYFRDEHETDDGNAIVSNIMYGPFMTAPAGKDGYLTKLKAVLAKGSGSVNWSVTGGQSALEALDATALFTGTWSGDGLSYSARPRTRGAGVVITISNGGNRRWALDALLADVMQAGELIHG